MRRAGLRYLAAGGLLFLLDYAVTRLLYASLGYPLEIAQWSGRLAGALAGYRLHRRFTFRARGGGTRPLRYWAVAAVLWLLSPLVLVAALRIVPGGLLGAKILTETVLMVSSYLALRHFVFSSSSRP